MLRNMFILVCGILATVGLTSCALFQKHEVSMNSPYFDLLKGHARNCTYQGTCPTEDEKKKAANGILILAVTMKGDQVRFEKNKIYVQITNSEIVDRLSFLQRELRRMVVLFGGWENFNTLFPKSMTRVAIAQALGDYRFKHYTGDISVSKEARISLLSSEIVVTK